MQRWDTPDGDFVEVARLAGPTPSSPRLLLFHGLEGGVHSHYARAMFRESRARGWAADLLLFRSCGSEPNRLPRSYHSGETSDPKYVVARVLEEFPDAPVGLMGVSLGGNVLCKLLGEWGSRVAPGVKGAVAVSAPFDLARASRHIGRGFGVIYERNFLRSLIPKAVKKMERHRELASLMAVKRARTLWDFDDQFTAPVHGFRDAADYYARASSLPYLASIKLPTLLLNAQDDPFLPVDVLDHVEMVAANNRYLCAEFPRRGGHVGFTAGAFPWSAWYYAEWRAAEFLSAQFG
jgi:predicted alpha/beta-fold hydrolase